MGENSSIEWCTHTFSPWWGCDKVLVRGDPMECRFCYAEVFARRWGTKWGPREERRVFGEQHWNEPRRWNRKAKAAGERHRVFCASMADVFDVHAPEGQRERLWGLIRETSDLDWLLLTKRPTNVMRMLPSDWGAGYPNAWLGTSSGHEDTVHRIEQILSVPARVHFVSCEPLFGPVCFQPYMVGSGPRLDWVICGGESGQQARRMDLAWARDLRDQCVATKTPFFFKQGGQYTESGVKVVSKHDAGRVLDGRTWDELPMVV